jgi:hypothetical protein
LFTCQINFSLIVTSSLSLVGMTFDDTDADEEDIDDDDVLLICYPFIEFHIQLYFFVYQLTKHIHSK